MKNSEYWKKRFIELENAQNKKSEKYLNILKKEYDKALARIEKDITNWYVRIANNNEISYSNAKKLLDKKELQEFKWTVQEYIEKGKENEINQQWIKELENASARVHIDKLNAIKMQIQNELEHLYDKQNKGVENLLKQQYEDSYYKSSYTIQNGLEKYWNIQSLDINKIDRIISKPWTTDNKTFSDRIWKNKDELLNTLQKDLTQSAIRGDDLSSVISKLSKDFNISKNRAGTLVMTESAFFSSAGQKECFNNLDVEKYEIVATLDSRTSEICQELDGKVFDMKDYEVGITAPPFHCNCRSTTVPYFDDEFTQNEKRFYRDENGNTGYVDANMGYKEWKEKYVTNGNNNDIMYPTYIRMNIKEDFNPESEVNSINAAILEMPTNIQKEIRNSNIEIFTEGKIIRNGKIVKTSFYDRKQDVIYIYQGSDKYEVIHEIGHMIETKKNILSDIDYIMVRKNSLENYSMYSITELKEYNKIAILSQKFISMQQGIIYKYDLNRNYYINKDGTINLNCLGEYFSEGFREYFQNNEHLKNKDFELFNYIKGVLENYE